jgi:hypothetical protein
MTLDGNTAARLGVISAALLVASFRWAHHWGPLSAAIVTGWALATLAALFASGWSLRMTRGSQRAARIGLSLALVSVLVVTLAGVLSAAGTDVSGACGGG